MTDQGEIEDVIGRLRHVDDMYLTIEAADLLQSLSEENKRLRRRNNELEDQIDTFMGRRRRDRSQQVDAQIGKETDR